MSGPMTNEALGHGAHPFPDPRAELDAARMGMWLFLVTEILLFGGLFCAFAVFRSWYLPAFLEGRSHLDAGLGTINTLVLITSSLTMALAVRAGREGAPRRCGAMLLCTLALGAAFLGIKLVEYHHKVVEGLLPGQSFTATGFAAPHGGTYFALYFLMTGLHGLHVIAGMSLMVWLWRRNRRRPFSANDHTPIEVVGLYWHLVDMIWIYLFPLLYLAG